ncbi:hypothetical protein A0H81_04754 [Grifola frondosa]|uniref:Uncharacterized protein n=1 Tax=Grifola frondosa TaxID=5627 RepID=A0A1C7MHR9_GRIFR|nr:hypothetical protein A0H81_04754 [Grifola frondosa]
MCSRSWTLHTPTLCGASSSRTAWQSRCSSVELLGNLHNTQIVEVVLQKGRERAKVLFAFSGQGG